MKTTSISVLIAFIFLSCSPKIGSTIKSKQPALLENEYVLILQKEENFINDGIEVGIIKAGDNGFSTNCTYNEVIDKLKHLARQNGANLIKIVDHKNPDAWSTCDRITAKIYRVHNFKVHENEIEWTKNRRLTWDDFKGSPKTISNTNTAAQTYCGFSFITNRVTMFKKAKIFTKNSFDCNLSWVRIDQKDRLDLLEHEQAHFDLSEVYSRILRKSLEERNLTVYNLTNDANVIFKEVYAAYLAQQELFEAETNYGLDLKKQKEWIEKITEDLLGLDRWTTE